MARQLLRKKSFQRSMPVLHLTEDEYANYTTRLWPINDLIKKYGPVLKVTVPKKYWLHEASTFHEKRYWKRTVERLRVSEYIPQYIQEANQEAFAAANDRKAEKQYLRKPVEQLIKEFENETCITLRKNPTCEEVDKVIKAAGRAKAPYIVNLDCDLRKQPDEGKFLNPAAINSPLQLAHKLGDLKQPWLFLGPPLSSTFMHVDDYRLCVMNVSLNDGKKLWVIIHPKDAGKLTTKLKQTTADKSKCPQSTGAYSLLLPLSVLIAWKIRFYVTIQRQQEVIILGKNTMHQCINLSFAINRTAAFIDEDRCMYRYWECSCPSKKQKHDRGPLFDGKQLLRQWKARHVSQRACKSQPAGMLVCNHDECDKRFSEKKRLNEHVKRKHDDPSICCSKCHKWLPTVGRLREHMRNKHEGKWMKCPKCKYRTRVSGNLTKHVRRCRDGESDPCSLCGKVFRFTKDLKIHLERCRKKDWL